MADHPYDLEYEELNDDVPMDALEEDVAERKGFVVAQLKEAVGFNTDEEFELFKKKIVELMKICFDVRFLRAQQEEGCRRFKRKFITAYPAVMAVDTEARFRLVDCYLGKAYGRWRHQDHKERLAKANESCASGVMAEEEEGSQPVTSSSSQTTSSSSKSSTSNATSTSTPPSSTSRIRLHPERLPFQTNSSTTSSSTNLNLNPTTNPTPRPSRVRKRSPSIELLSSPPPGAVFPQHSPATAPTYTFHRSPKRPRTTTTTATTATSTNPTVTASSPKQQQQPIFKHVHTPNASKKARRLGAAQAGGSSPTKGSSSGTNNTHSLTSQLQRCTLSPLPPPSPSSSSSSSIGRKIPILARFNPSTSSPPCKREEDADDDEIKYIPSPPHTPPTPSSSSCTPSSTTSSASSSSLAKLHTHRLAEPSTLPLETQGIRYFLHAHPDPSLHKFLPALVLIKSTLPKLKALSAQPPRILDELWLGVLRKRCAEYHRTFGGGDGDSMGGGGAGPLRMTDEVRGLGRVVAPDDTEGVMLIGHLYDFWKRHC